MTFWDTSAILPLLVEESDSVQREQSLIADPEMAVWFGTAVEIASAISRREREGLLSVQSRAQADKRLAFLSRHWVEVNPTKQVRNRTIRALQVHALRAGDAFQLAAALALCRDEPGAIPFLTADARLAEAARREGFPTDR